VASKEIIEQVRRDFEFLKPRVLGVLLFGSQVRGDVVRGDIDICIVAPGQDKVKLLFEVFEKVDVYGKRYDVYVFEELPLYMRFEVIENHELVLSKNPPELYEYLYFYRKLLEDYRWRLKKAE